MPEPKTKKKPSVLERAIGKILGVVKLKEHYYPFAEKNMMPLISRQQAAVNELDQMDAVYGKDWLDQPGANRAIMPHTYGRAAAGALPTAVPGARAGFSADGATYTPPATHYAEPQITRDTDASSEQEDEAWMAWRDAKKRGTTNDPVGPFIERYLAQNKVAAMTTEERRAHNRKITEPTK